MTAIDPRTHVRVSPMIRYVLDGPVDNDALNALFAASWEHHAPADFVALADASAFYVEAFDNEALVGFVRVLACGRERGFVLGPTVHPSSHGKGIGKGLLDAAASAAEEWGMTSLHVEFASHLRPFYAAAGFRHTAAGVRKLHPKG